jgi:hypothetical protein
MAFATAGSRPAPFASAAAVGEDRRDDQIVGRAGAIGELSTARAVCTP